MKIFIPLLLLATGIAHGANEVKKSAPQQSGQAWKNVDTELSKGAKKIGGILEKQGIDTKDNSAGIKKEEAAPAPTASPEAVPPPPGEEGFAAKANRIWFKILGKGDDALNTQRTENNKEPEKSP